MDLDWTPAEEAFRQEVRDFIAKELTDEVKGSMFINTPERVALSIGASGCVLGRTSDNTRSVK